MNIKDSNPKDKIGISKCPQSTLSGPVMSEVGVAMMEGALKYGRHNYREVGVRASVYFDALQRHIWAWYEGESIDPDSGLSHVTKAISCLMVLRDAEINGKLFDDRPPKSPKNWQDELNKKTKELLEKYPNPVEPYTEINNKKSSDPDLSNCIKSLHKPVSFSNEDHKTKYPKGMFHSEKEENP